jgi:HlyD family secretion protein
MSSEVRIAAATRADALIVPIQSVTVRAEKSLPDAPQKVEEGTQLSAPKRAETLAKVVFVVDGEQKAHPRRVKTGNSSDTDFEVLEGLAEGETIVEGPYRTLAKDLKDGDPVREAKPEGGPGGPGGRNRT